MPDRFSPASRKAFNVKVVPPSITWPTRFTNLGGLLDISANAAAEIEAFALAQFGAERYDEAIEVLRQATVDFRIKEIASMMQVQAQVNAMNQKVLDTLKEHETLAAFHFTVNDIELVKQMNQYVGEQVLFTRAYNTAISEFIPRVKGVLGAILETLANKQDPRAFPKEYVGPMLQAVQNRIRITPHGNSPIFFYVELPDLFLALGGQGDLEAAYHHGARLKRDPFASRPSRLRTTSSQWQRGNILTGPIPQSALEQQSARRRYLYWSALSQGKPFYTTRATSPGIGTGRNTNRDKKGRFSVTTVDIPIEGSWRETIDARLAVWASRGGKAPQWLLLEFGQNAYEPRIVPGNVLQAWIDTLQVIWDRVIAKVWDEQIKRFNITPTPPAGPGAYGRFLTNRIGNYYSSPAGGIMDVQGFRIPDARIGASAGGPGSSGVFSQLVESSSDDHPYWHGSNPWAPEPTGLPQLEVTLGGPDRGLEEFGSSLQELDQLGSSMYSSPIPWEPSGDKFTLDSDSIWTPDGEKRY